ncbi:PQQ-binding-like beta-propeller repeat protein [Actinotalea sp. Marseille-Q4924]|uniref:outer membrane protein assembly factor BamB family protein n=1 Tax=Actinotalea sp. Marseille-Q4924 TaxID=2866571 RepID=UPI001CE3EF07|nr:PQQ-binding-like beta-propeller repeat protein [Actinotalea sp. Marseille-Q4924]
MSAGSGRPEPVELTDETVPTAPDDVARAPRPPAATASRWWAAALLLALAAALVVGALVSAGADNRDDDDVARLAGVQGFTGSLREPLVELWSTGDRVVGHGAGLVLLEDRAAPSSVRAVEAGTGTTRWRGGWTSRTGVTHCEAASGVVLCEVLGTGFGSPNTDEMLGEVPGRLLAVDAGDGTLLGETALDGRTVGWAVVGGDAVVARRDGDRLTVSRLTVPTGAPGSSGPSAGPGPWETVWTTRFALPGRVTANQLTLRVERGSVVVDGRLGVVLDVVDGSITVAPQQAAGGGSVRVVVATTGAGVWTAPGTGTWHDRRGTVTTLDGDPVAEAPRDDSAPDVVLLEGSAGLRAVDVVSGTTLWERPAQPWRRVARVGGSVVLVEPGALAVVDVLSGAESWRRSLPAAPDGPPAAAAFVLDARRVLLGGALTGAGPVVLDLDDGVQLWAADAPSAGTLRPGTGPAVVLVGGDGRTAAWGPEAA